jgi:hypothetical protein|tara:strand:+ start:162 stop:755 length:594 start_codon:yes stop_codon:yes gene_type:complete
MEILTYCAHNIEVNHNKIEQEILSIPLTSYHYDKFRNTYILPLFNPAGKIGKVDINLNRNMKWTMDLPNVQKAFSPILDELPGRFTILYTPPNKEMNIHLDCKEAEVGTRQYKWRYVVKGDLKGLYFLNENMEKIYPNQGERSYVMDGGHPHSIDISDKPKWTLCVGSPWRDNLPSDLDTSKSYIISRPKIKDQWSV